MHHPQGTGALLAMILFAGTAFAAPQRETVNGLVLDAAGEPIVGAMVTFLGAPLPIVDAYTNVDRVEGSSGDDGRFTVQLLRHADYSAWATERTVRGRETQVSAVRHLVAAGDQVTFTVAELPRFRSVRPEGLDAWSERGPCTIAIAPNLPVVALQAVTLKDGEVALPPFPGSWHVYVRDVDGVLVHAETLAKAQEGIAKLQLAAPRAMRVRTVDEMARPVAGASVWVRLGSRLQRATDVAGAASLAIWQPVGTTNDDGLLPLTLGIASEDVLAVVARAPGHRPGLAGWWFGHLHASNVGPQPRDDDDLPLLLHTGDGVIAHCMLNGTQVRARAGPSVAVRAVPGSRRDWQLVADPRGSWQPDIEPHRVVQAIAAMPAGAGVVPAIARIDLDAQRELRVVDLATLRLEAPAGAAPRASVRVLVQPAGIELLQRTEPPITALAVALPATLQLGVGRWRLLASDGERFAMHELDLLPGVTNLHLAMQPLVVRRGRLYANDGVLPLGATFRCFAGSPWPDTDKLSVHLEPFEQPATPQALPVLPDDLAFAMANWLAARAQVLADGTFTVPMLRCYAPRFPLVVESGGRCAMLPAYVQRRAE